MRGKNSARLAMPPVFALPPAIQKMSWKLASALAAESALVAFESLTNSTRPFVRADLLHAVGKAGKTGEALLDRRQIEAERDAGGNRAGGVLRVVLRRASEPMPASCATGCALPPAARRIRLPSA